jgi:hypothetical protein
MFSRDKLAKTAEEVANHLLLVDHVKALQQGQRDLAAAISAVNDRLTAMEAEFKVLKSEAQRDALREVQNAVNAVQGAFHDKLSTLSTKIAIIEHVATSQRPTNGPALAYSEKNAAGGSSV